MFEKLLKLFQPDHGHDLIHPPIAATATPDGAIVTVTYKTSHGQQERKYYRTGDPVLPVSPEDRVYDQLPPFIITWALQTRPVGDDQRLQWGRRNNGKLTLRRNIPNGLF